MLLVAALLVLGAAAYPDNPAPPTVVQSDQEMNF
jgi:hypothetical protein